MVSIRNNVFETNSSSVHSFVLSKENTISTRIKRINLSSCVGKEFGWGFVKYTKPEDKLSYLLALVYYFELKSQIYKECSSKRKDSNLLSDEEDLLTQEDRDSVQKYIQKYNSTLERIENLLKSKNVVANFSKIGIRKITQKEISQADVLYYDYCTLPVDVYIDHIDCAKYFYTNIMNSDRNILNWIFGKSFFLTGTDNCDDEEIRWTKRNVKAKFPHDLYEKGN